MTTPPLRTIEVPTDDDYPVRGDLYVPAGDDCSGVVVLCHGFKGYKSWGFFPYLAQRLRVCGLAAVSMDMSFNGTYPAPGGNGELDSAYVRPDLFQRNTLRREYLDVKAVIRMIAGGGLREDVGGAPLLGLFGHSRGAVACMLNALEEPAVKALCTWSAVADPDFYSDHQKERWRRDGAYTFSDLEGTPLAVGIDYLNDLEENHEFYRVVGRVRELKVPHLIVHGAADVVIPIDNASALHEAETQLSERRLVVLRTGHTFGLPYPTPHPMPAPPPPLMVAADETVAWFKRYLSPEGGP